MEFLTDSLHRDIGDNISLSDFVVYPLVKNGAHCMVKGYEKTAGQAHVVL
jgi:hypothetical protein